MRSRRRCQLFWWNFLRLKNRVWENICVQVLIAILDLLVTATNPDSHPLPHTSDSPQYWFPPHDQTSPSYSPPSPHCPLVSHKHNNKKCSADPPRPSPNRPELTVIPPTPLCRAYRYTIRQSLQCIVWLHFLLWRSSIGQFPCHIVKSPCLYGIMVLHGYE